jgi:hypothetical protein
VFGLNHFPTMPYKGESHRKMSARTSRDERSGFTANLVSFRLTINRFLSL